MRKKLPAVFIIFISIGCIKSFAQTPVTAINTSQSTASPTVVGSENWGQGNDLFLVNVEIGTDTYIYDPNLVPTRFEFIRVDNTLSSGFRNRLMAERQNNTNYNPTYPPANSNGSRMEAALQEPIINRGALDVFHNVNAGSQRANNIERVDVLYNPILAPATPFLDEIGFLVSEKNGNNGFKIAVITSVDGSGNPASYGPLVTIDTGDYGEVNPALLWRFIENAANPPHGDPVGYGNSSEQYGFSLVTFDDLGVNANDLVYGISVFGIDVTGIGGQNLLNPTTFPQNTNEGADIHGGLGSLVKTTNVVFDTDNDNDGIPDITDLDDDNDGITDQEEVGDAYNNFQPPCSGSTLDFSGTFTEESGDGNVGTFLIGEVFRFPNVSPGVDALVTIVNTFNTSVPLLDDNGTDPASFKPQTSFSLTNIGEQAYVEYNFQFVQAGGTTPVLLDEFFVNFNDVDGNTNFGEQNWSESPASFSLENPTQLTLDNVGPWIIGTSGTNEFAGVLNSNPEVNYSTRHVNKSSYTVRLGVVARASNVSASGRQHSVEFVCLTNFVSPDTFLTDFDGDGIPNHFDLDSDNDGITDVEESGGTDDNNDGIADGSVATNGIPATAGTGTVPLNSDGTIGDDYLDIDADDDGIPDNIEAQPTDGYTAPSGVGTGITDANGNGVDDNYENGAFVGIDPENTDGADDPDYIDDDSDDDGIHDIEENGDTDNTVSGNDSDNDGLDDAFDDNDDSATEGATVNDGINPPDGSNLGDEDNDLPTGGDVDYRDQPNPDSDGDGINDDDDLDDDNDGIPDAEEASGDTDGDGVPDRLDLDSDNDGVPDIVEAGGTDTDGDGQIDYPTPGNPTSIIDTNNDGLDDNLATDPLPNPDSDGDGINDAVDLDSDNDGISDVTEAGGTDANADGILDGFADIDGDGLADSVDSDDNTVAGNGDGGEPLDNPDTDGDGIDDRLDLDSDNDGVPDIIEAGGTDADSDGQIDYPTPGNPSSMDDADNDGLADEIDPDDNTTPTPSDGPGTPLENPDSDGDGVPNRLDFDSDNDGIPDVTEAGGTDTDGDGIIDGFADADEDGLDDTTAATPLDDPDSDSDGVADRLDLDADNDGIPDIVEAGGTDTDGDGQVDYPTPGDPSSMDDVDNDGLADEVDPDDNTAPGTGDGTGTPLENPDTDSDGVNNRLDLDSDNDGIPDVLEAGGDDPDGNGQIGNGPIVDVNENGFSEIVDEPEGGTALPLTDTDTDGLPDFLDIDSDNDGITDAEEAFSGAGLGDPENDGQIGSGNPTVGANGWPDVTDPNDGGTLPAFTNSDADTLPNHLDLDSDGDGLPDTYEGNFEVVDGDNDGIVGTGTPVDSDGDGLADSNDPDSDGNVLNGAGFNQDRDGDGVPNYLDIDIDNDGIIDNIEGQSTSGYIPPTGNDTDNDGLDDAYDVDNGGEGIGYTNTDGGSAPDYADVDSENDGLFDIEENNIDDTIDAVLDTDSDGILDPANFVDADGDGLADIFDTVSGTTDADNATNGQQTPLDQPDTDPADGDRDWRESATQDNDQDGILDVVDLDDDNDGILDVDEDENLDGDNNPRTNPSDSDGDGIPNYFDLDSDNDGIPDVTEAGGTDDDGNGQPGSGVLGPGDVDANGVPTDTNGGLDTTEPEDDLDGDGNPNFLDLDSDNDGIFDVIEAVGIDPDGNGEYGAGTANDIDADGLADELDPFDNRDGESDTLIGGNPLPIPNTDGNANDGLDYLDIDADDDGIPDNVEAQPTDAYTAPSGTTDDDGVDTNYPDGLVPEDTDEDGTPDYLDTDSDDDDIDDVTEAGQGSPTGTDTDGDGLDDGFDDTPGNDVNNDLDTGAEGTNNIDDPGTPEVDFREAPLDEDGDGIPDVVDVDDDNDGISDIDESGGVDPSADNDDDGVPNYLDDEPDNPAVGDANGTVESAFDFDGDGIPNHFDIDGDNDGIPDVVESGNGALDTNNDGVIDTNDDNFTDTDGDGQADGATANTPPNSDGNANDGPDFLDIDADDDGIVDNIEGQSTAGYIPPTGNDSDGDGLDDAYDIDDGGTAIVPENTDGTDESDYIDTDADNDGIEDIVEGWDTDADGTPEVTPSGTDADGDGLDDAFDNDDANPDPTNGQSPIDFPDAQLPGGDQDWRQGVDVDSDGDGVLDDQEIADGTDPNNPCDFDFANVTVEQSGDYLVSDCDGDGVTNGDELAGPDGDSSTLDDNTDPFEPCDFDTNSITVAQSGAYLTTDCDGDGVINGMETTDGTDPNDPCDFDVNSITVDFSGEYLIADCDGDGISNGQEITDGTDPNDPCSSRGGSPPPGADCDIEIDNDLVGPNVDEGFFRIINIESFPNNTVEIYNRWGVKVFETNGYDNRSNVFRGISNGRATIRENEELPAGVYFYVINYVNNGAGQSRSGYLYVNR